MSTHNMFLWRNNKNYLQIIIKYSTAVYNSSNKTIKSFV